MSAVDVLGWAGSALLVYSVLQSRMLRFRVLNLAASGALVVFNALVGVWPMVAMNVALCAINTWFIVSLVRRRSSGTAFEWVAAAPDDPFVTRFLGQHGDDVARFWPAARTLPTLDVARPNVLCALVLHGDVTVGLVVAVRERDAAATWELLVDYVVPGYRDYTAGSLIYSPAGPFVAREARRVVSTGVVAASVRPYLHRAGFTLDGDRWARAL